MQSDLLLGISQVQIESESADIARQALGADITAQQEKKSARIRAYVEDKASWHKGMLDLD